MDSGSGSMQSSSGCGGGDEEYDSRAESISAFFNSSNPTSHVGPMPNPPIQPPPSSSSTSMYQDTLFTNFFDHPSLTKSPNQNIFFNTNTNSFGNLDMVWSKNPNSCSDLGNLMGSSSSTQQQPFRGSTSFQVNQESVQKASVSASNDTATTTSNVGRNPKKRSRASRRAPTTVLTTDTTNFRAMVQEFTGIPAPPFTSLPRSRLDLFGTAASALRLGIGSSQLDVSQGSPYLLRPFAQKVQPPLQFIGSSMVDAMASTTVTTTTAGSNSNNSSQVGYQMPSDSGQQSQNLFNINMQNPVLNFQPFLDQAPPRYTSAILGSKQPQGAASSLGIQSTDDSQLKMGTLEDHFGTSSHGQVHAHHSLGGLQDIVSSEGWPGINGDFSTGTSHHGVDVTNNGNRLDYGGALSDVHGDKGPENVAPRSEGVTGGEIWGSLAAILFCCNGIQEIGKIKAAGAKTCKTDGMSKTVIIAEVSITVQEADDLHKVDQLFLWEIDRS